MAPRQLIRTLVTHRIRRDLVKQQVHQRASGTVTDDFLTEKSSGPVLPIKNAAALAPEPLPWLGRKSICNIKKDAGLCATRSNNKRLHVGHA